MLMLYGAGVPNCIPKSYAEEFALYLNSTDVHLLRSAEIKEGILAAINGANQDMANAIAGNPALAEKMLGESKADQREAELMAKFGAR